MLIKYFYIHLPIGGQKFALKVGFSKWFDSPDEFCKKLKEYKENYAWWYNHETLQQIQQKLEFTKFQCKEIGNNKLELCSKLKTFENKLSKLKC